ncbi:MAG: hypothetical protein GZ091_01890 [Paludibacter sp.]|nr:hypothetical protein [Paludibacter sp.]
MNYKSRFRELILKELLAPLVAIFTILIISFLGFIFIEGFSPLTTLYMLVTTFTMIGYGDVVPITDIGRIFTIIIILSGFSLGLYSIGKITAFFAEGELSTLLKQRKMNKTLDKMKDHFIICGYGKTGKRVLDNLLVKGLEVVMIENNPDKSEKLKEIYDKKFWYRRLDRCC